MIKKITVLCKPNQPEALRLAETVAAWLAHEGVITVKTNTADKIAADSDLVVIIGGDGTILGAGRQLANTGIPICGINFGKIGFLTSCEANEWQPFLDKALNCKLPKRNCAILRWRLFRENKLLKEGFAINDVVMARGRIARLVSIELAINSIFLAELRCDGIIACSPLGSSGYNSSAGGPILSPIMAACCVTTICPFMSRFQPIVLPAQTDICLVAHTDANDCSLTIDGQESWPLQDRDQLHTVCATDGLTILGDEMRFIAKLGKYYSNDNSSGL